MATLGISIAVAQRFFVFVTVLWCVRFNCMALPADLQSSCLLLLHCQAKLDGLCEQLEGPCESDTGANSSSPDAEHCLLQTLTLMIETGITADQSKSANSH